MGPGLRLLLGLLAFARADGYFSVFARSCVPLVEHRSGLSLQGVPKLFRWLVDSYPIISEPLSLRLEQDSLHVDNFYLDMNGIIHSCTHNNMGTSCDLTEAEMFDRIFAYTDRLYKFVKPRELMFLAVDGVAPKAKMNQQRARRFRASQEQMTNKEQLHGRTHFDTNAITPGTGFMQRLGIATVKWIDQKMKSDTHWQRGARVLFSGADVAGEGEHKIMELTRTLAAQKQPLEPVGNHCIYGLDADLIMLGLVARPARCLLLREKSALRKRDPLSFTTQNFDVVDVAVLRQTLGVLFVDAVRSAGLLATEDSVGRTVDDFVFLCFLVGNDFLPSLAQLDIADGALTLIVETYMAVLPSLGGFITDKEKIHLPRFELFLQEMTRREPLFFAHRMEQEPQPDGNYKRQHYENKLQVAAHQTRDVVEKYLEGLLWTLHYYHRGCLSWTWSYPYHYPPLASDMTGLADLDPRFSAGAPIPPLLQLLSVLPPQSSGLLPSALAALMREPSLAPYFPADFEVDANGKTNSWESVVKIPILPQNAVLAAAEKVNHLFALSAEERLRNIKGAVHQFDPRDYAQ